MGFKQIRYCAQVSARGFMKKIFAGFLLLVLSIHAQASYMTADLATIDANAKLGTHVVVAGQGLEDGTTWLKAAQTQAMVYRDRHDHGTIRMISAVDDSKKAEYLQMLKNWGYSNIRFTPQAFLGQSLVAELTVLPLIASLDFIGHNGAFFGLALQDEGSNHRFYKSNVDEMVGKVHFSKDSFIRLIGCNTGWFLAPYMASKLGVPVEGTLTSSDVQFLFSTGSWYFDESGAHPSSSVISEQNSLSFLNPQACTDHVGCVRLRPENGPYFGQHGAYTGALPFLKFFCGSVEQQDCFRRMAASVTYFVGTSTADSPEHFAESIADKFCPANLDLAASAACHLAVGNHILGLRPLAPAFTTLSSKVSQLVCDFQGCQFSVVKDGKGQNILVSAGKGPSTAFVDELNAYRAGFAQLAR